MIAKKFRLRHIFLRIQFQNTFLILKANSTGVCREGQKRKQCLLKRIKGNPINSIFCYKDDPKVSIVKKLIFQCPVNDVKDTIKLKRFFEIYVL